MLKRLITNGIVVAGLASALSACDTDQEIELATRKYDGPVEIQLYRDVLRGDHDSYVMKIVDSDGNIIAEMNSRFDSKTRVVLDSEKEFNLGSYGIVPIIR